MNIEQARTIAKEKLEELAKELEHGQSATLKEYLAAMARFPNYSARNVLLIQLQRPEAQHIASWTTWRRLGRFVRRGRHGIAIMAPIVRRLEANADHPASVPAEADEMKNRVIDERVCGFRTATVFDISDTDGSPLPSFAVVRGNPGVYLERLKAFVAQQGIRISYSDRIAPALGVSYGNEIILLPHMTLGEEFGTLVHEATHATLHQQEDRRSLPRRVLETEAEAAAYVVCQAIGLDPGTSCSDYIHLNDGAQTLAASLDRIQRTASQIITAIGPDV